MAMGCCSLPPGVRDGRREGGEEVVSVPPPPPSLDEATGPPGYERLESR